jgi:hypothetical protein
MKDLEGSEHKRKTGFLSLARAGGWILRSFRKLVRRKVNHFSPSKAVVKENDGRDLDV